MDEILALWSNWIKPSAGLPTVQWSLLLAVAAAAGHLLQRQLGLPKVVGYSLVGTLAGLGGFAGTAWPLQGVPLFLLELGVSLVLFEAGGRLALRWLRHNPMVLVQSLAESLLTVLAVHALLRALGQPPAVAQGVSLVALAASPAVLSRVVMDLRAAGPVTERALALSTLNTFYALTLVSAWAGTLGSSDIGPDTSALGPWLPVGLVLGVSVIAGALLAGVLRGALRLMSPASENTAILLICAVAAVSTLASNFGGSAPLAALLGGLLLKQWHARPWAWPRQLGTAGSLLTMLMFVLVSVVAAGAPWNPALAGVVIALLAVRVAAKVAGVVIAHPGSGLSWRQSAWAGCAMSPMSSVALLLVWQFAAASATRGPAVAAIALPAILVMEVLGAVLATWALLRAGERT